MSVRLGVNLTRPSQIVPFRELHSEGVIDFIEVLLDNFACYQSGELVGALEGIPRSCHIMHSRWLERLLVQLEAIGSRLRPLIEELKPIYVADHLARFHWDRQPLPLLAEHPYEKFDEVIAHLIQWQEILRYPIALENFASYSCEGIRQPTFFDRLMEGGAAMVFDVSNALVADLNGVCKMGAWRRLYKQARHFHVAGFSRTPNAAVCIDSHDLPLSVETKDALCAVLKNRMNDQVTVTVEYDHGIDLQAWRRDLQELRARLQ